MNTAQFSTFVLSDRTYGIEITKVQEIVKKLPMTHVPLAPDCVLGLINLRGQVATAFGLREFFNLEKSDKSQGMNVICELKGHLIAFQVDEIGDVIEVPKNELTQPPANLPTDLKKYISSVCKNQDRLVCIIDINKIYEKFAA